MRYFYRTRCLCALAMLLAAPLMVFAQGSTTTLAGIVRDEQALVVPGASVSVIGAENGLTRTVTTQADGGFNFPGLLSGSDAGRMVRR